MDSSLPERVELLGVGIHSVTFTDAVHRIQHWMREKAGPCRYVITPNINHLVLHQNNAEFRAAYDNASLVLPDGRYVIALSRLLGTHLAETVNGSDLVPAIFDAYSADEELRVFLLGAMPGVAERASARIESKWPAVSVVGAYSPPFGFETSERETDSILARIKSAEPDLLVLGISPPKQEIWNFRNVGRISACVSICAGATIDFLGGEKKRAPAWMQTSGMEWLFRTLSEPVRLGPRYLRDGVAITKLLFREFRRRSRQPRLRQ